MEQPYPMYTPVKCGQLTDGRPFIVRAERFNVSDLHFVLTCTTWDTEIDPKTQRLSPMRVHDGLAKKTTEVYLRISKADYDRLRWIQVKVDLPDDLPVFNVE